MMLNNNLRDLFIDPISLELLRDPVINGCGHSYERGQIDGWRAHKVSLGVVPDCPLCRAPLDNLIPNRLLRDALGVMNDPDNGGFENIEDLTTEEQEQVQNAIDAIRQRRQADQANGVPDRLPEPQSFLQKFSSAVKECSDKYC